MTIGVGLGLHEFPFSGAAGFWRWVALCEEGGVDSLWQIDRLVSKRPFLEVMTTMAALAGATRRIKFGMNVAAVGLRDPLILAKECATVDFLSGGRLLPAFGIGSTVSPDWAATGRPTRARGERTDEALELIARLWREDAVTFHGEHYDYEGVTIAPKPVQKALPFWIGGSSPAAIRRTARFGTGWQAGRETPEQVAPVIAAIKQEAAALDRRIDDDHYGASFAFRFGRWEDAPVQHVYADYLARSKQDPRSHFVVGGAAAMVERMREYASAGVSKFILKPIGLGDDDLMDQTLHLIAEVIPEVQGKAAL